MKKRKENSQFFSPDHALQRSSREDGMCHLIAAYFLHLRGLSRLMSLFLTLLLPLHTERERELLRPGSDIKTESPSFSISGGHVPAVKSQTFRLRGPLEIPFLLFSPFFSPQPTPPKIHLIPLEPSSLPQGHQFCLLIV